MVVYYPKQLTLEDMTYLYLHLMGDSEFVFNNNPFSIFLEHEEKPFTNFLNKYIKRKSLDKAFIIPDTSVSLVKEEFNDFALEKIPRDEVFMGYPNYMLDKRRFASRLFQDNMIYDGYFAFVLVKKGLLHLDPIAAVGLYPVEGILRIQQLQGYSSSIKGTRWPNALIEYVLDWAHESGIPAVVVQKGTNQAYVYNCINLACDVYNKEVHRYVNEAGSINLELWKNDFPDENNVISDIRKHIKIQNRGKKRRDRIPQPGLMGPYHSFQIYDVSSIMVERKSPYPYLKLVNKLIVADTCPKRYSANKGEHLFVTNIDSFNKVSAANIWGLSF